MKTYLVRMIEDQQLVGIIVANSIEFLRDCVDEVIDPNICEYATMPEGGIHWSNRAPRIPVQGPWDENGELPRGHDIPWRKASISECWHDSLYTDDGLKRWTPCVPNNHSWLPGIGLLYPHEIGQDRPLKDIIAERETCMEELV